MTTSAVIPQITFAGSSGSGTLGPFSLIKSGTPIHFTANSQIKVYRYDTTTDSAPTLLVEGTDYDLTGGPNAGSLTLTSPQTGLLTVERLFVYREQPTTQTLDLITGGNFSAANLEARFDRTTEMIQELRREVQATVRFSLFDTDNIPNTLPLGAVIDKLVYVTGTPSAPVLATLDYAADLAANLTIVSANIANVNLVGSDLSGADTIGIVAADLDGDNNIGAVAAIATTLSTNIDDIVTVAGAIDAGTIGDLLDGQVGKVATLAALQAYTAVDGQLMHMAGRTAAGDGAEGLFRFSTSDLSSSVGTDEVTSAQGDGGIYIAPTSDKTGASGAWVRLESVHANVKWYGATGDGSTDDTTAIQAAITAANSTSHKTVYFPAGTYKCTGQLTLNSGATWVGDGPGVSVIKADAALGNQVFIKTATTANPATSVSSITSASTTATVTTSSAHGYTTGDSIRIIGASPSEYLGEYTITVTGSTTFTYTFAGSGTSPATGTITCAPVGFNQTDVALYDLHIQGFDAVLTATASAIHSSLMRLWSIDGLTIERCKFSAHRYIMLSLGGTKNFSIRNNEFENWGRTDDLASSGTLPVNEGGAAIWCAANPIDDTPTTHGTMRGNYFHDAQWSCVYLLGQNLDFSFNRMENFKEGNFATSTSIFATTLPGTSESRNITYIGNFHKGVTERLIQAAGFECGGINVIVADNYFEDCDGAAIDFTDAAENCVATGNVCINCATSAYSTNYASIVARLTNVTTKACNGITISHNVIRSTDDGQHGIRLYRIPPATDTFSNIHVFGNDLVGSASSSNNYLTYDATEFGTNVALYNNQGASDYAVSATWTPTISASSGTLTTTSTPTARYWADGPTVHFSISITVTDNGTGAGILRFTLPTTPAYAGACVGANTANGKAVHGNWGTTTTVNVNYYDGTYPVASGHTIRISGSYMTA